MRYQILASNISYILASKQLHQNRLVVS